jgi:dihydroorotase
VALVREAKRRGLPVSCEVTPHHLTLTDEACLGYDTSTKCAPPLRGSSDVEALRAALADGTIDCIATDHAPHAVQEKDLEFDAAAFGMIGLETALGLGLRLVDEKVLTLPQLITRLTVGGASVFGLPAGTLARGARADAVVLDLGGRFTVDAARLRSKSRNTPFAGWELGGRVACTIVGGQVVHEGAEVAS